MRLKKQRPLMVLITVILLTTVHVSAIKASPIFDHIEDTATKLIHQQSQTLVGMTWETSPREIKTSSLNILIHAIEDGLTYDSYLTEQALGHIAPDGTCIHSPDPQLFAVGKIYTVTQFKSYIQEHKHKTAEQLLMLLRQEGVISSHNILKKVAPKETPATYLSAETLNSWLEINNTKIKELLTIETNNALQGSAFRLKITKKTDYYALFKTNDRSGLIVILGIALLPFSLMMDTFFNPIQSVYYDHPDIYMDFQRASLQQQLRTSIPEVLMGFPNTTKKSASFLQIGGVTSRTALTPLIQTEKTGPHLEIEIKYESLFNRQANTATGVSLGALIFQPINFENPIKIKPALGISFYTPAISMYSGITFNDPVTLHLKASRTSENHELNSVEVKVKPGHDLSAQMGFGSYTSSHTYEFGPRLIYDSPTSQIFFGAFISTTLIF